MSEFEPELIVVNLGIGQTWWEAKVGCPLGPRRIFCPKFRDCAIDDIRTNIRVMVKEDDYGTAEATIRTAAEEGLIPDLCDDKRLFLSKANPNNFWALETSWIEPIDLGGELF